jgi:hypothetical protein
LIGVCVAVDEAFYEEALLNIGLGGDPHEKFPNPVYNEAYHLAE